MKAKALNDFKVWLADHENTCIVDHEILEDNQKWGVLVDFYDSVGIDINVKKFRGTGRFFYTIFDSLNQSYQDTLDTRPEARKQALIKAEQIYNEL